MDNCIDPRDDRADWDDLLVDTTLRRYRCSENAWRLDTQTENSWILIPRFKRHGALTGMNGGFSTFESSVGGKWLGL